MDLRTKLVFGLVAVSLGSMLALGTLAYTNAEALFARRTALSLSSLAEAKAERVESAVRGWQEAVGLLTSRTQLRRSLASWNRTQSEADREQIARILRDARASSRLVEGVAAHGIDGALVTIVGTAEPEWTSPADSVLRSAGISLVGFTDADPPLVAYEAELSEDDQRVGTLRALLSTEDLGNITANRTGLGGTGEALIAVPQGSGSVRLLTPRRHAPEGDDEASRAVAGALWQALEGVEGPVTRGLIDYRGEPVWAEMKRIRGADLRLVLKFDEAEERGDIIELRERMLGVGFSLAAFAILAGVALGFMFAKPIHALAVVAGRFRDGELDARADADREDELGLLAETFNAMGTELERRLTQLQEFKAFFDESRDMLCIAGTDGYFKRVNPAFERTLGWDAADLLGRPFIDFVHPEDIEATIGETERLAQGIPTVSFSNRYRCKDGTYKRLRWTSHPDPETGSLYASARSTDDITGPDGTQD